MQGYYPILRITGIMNVAGGFFSTSSSRLSCSSVKSLAGVGKPAQMRYCKKGAPIKGGGSFTSHRFKRYVCVLAASEGSIPDSYDFHTPRPYVCELASPGRSAD